MRLETIGKRTFAFGLSWRDAGGDADDLIEAEVVKGGNPYVSVLGNQDVVGFGTLDAAAAAKPPKEIFSFAALCASAGDEGIYVIPLSNGRWWYTSVRNGLVVPGTDRADSMDGVLDAIANIVAASSAASETGESVKVYSPIEIRQVGWNVFDPIAFERAAKIKPLKLMKKSSGQSLTIAAAVMVSALVGVAGWWFFLKGPSDAEQAAMDAEAIRQAYVGSVTQTLSSIPFDHAWVNIAFRMVEDQAPAFAHGYTKTEASCQPASCSVLFEAAQNSPFSPTEFQLSLGGSAVTISEDGSGASYSIAIATPTIVVDDSLIRAWPVLPDQLVDRLGVFPIYAADVSVTQGPTMEDLSTSLGGAPPGYRPIQRVTFVISPRGGGMLTSDRLSALSDFWANAGFVPASFRWTSGLAGGTETWQIEFVRISGQA